MENEPKRINPSYKNFSFLVIGTFYSLVLIFTINVPQQDDYDAILTYLLGAQDFFLNGLFDVHVSHRLAVIRMLAKLTLVFGEGANFQIIAIIGASSLLGVVLLLRRSIHMTSYSDREFLFCVLCLNIFSLFHWSNMAWATASVQHYGSLFIAVLTFHFFSKGTPKGLIYAVALGLIAPYLNSSGLLLLPILFLWSLTDLFYNQGHPKTIIVTSTATLFGFLVFFYFLPNQPDTGNLTDLAMRRGMIVPVLKSYLIATAGYLHFDILALISGAIINIYFMILISLRYFRKNGVVFYTFLYLLLSIMLIAMFRHELGVRQIIASRYQIYTLSLNALVIVSFFEMGFQRYINAAFFRQILLFMFGMLYLLSFYYLSNLTSEKEKIWSGLHDWHTVEARSLYHPQPQKASEILSLAIDTKTYSLPQFVD